MSNKRKIINYKKALYNKLWNKLATENIKKLCERYENMYLSTEIRLFRNDFNIYASDLLSYTSDIILDSPVVEEKDIHIIFDIVDNYIQKAKKEILEEQNNKRKEFVDNLSPYIKFLGRVFFFLFRFADKFNGNQ